MDQLFEAFLSAAAMALLTLGTVAVSRLADWLKLSADDKARGYLQDAMQRAIALGLERAKADAGLHHGPIPGTGEGMGYGLSLAGAYLRDRVPDALGRFKIGDEQLQQMLRARAVADGLGPADFEVPPAKPKSFA
jgi:hypothetical protein